MARVHAISQFADIAARTDTFHAATRRRAVDERMAQSVRDSMRRSARSFVDSIAQGPQCGCFKAHRHCGRAANAPPDSFSKVDFPNPLFPDGCPLPFARINQRTHHVHTRSARRTSWRLPVHLQKTGSCPASLAKGVPGRHNALQRDAKRAVIRYPNTCNIRPRLILIQLVQIAVCRAAKTVTGVICFVGSNG